jgi:hypothetical protein
MPDNIETTCDADGGVAFRTTTPSRESVMCRLPEIPESVYDRAESDLCDRRDAVVRIECSLVDWCKLQARLDLPNDRFAVSLSHDPLSFTVRFHDGTSIVYQ